MERRYSTMKKALLAGIAAALVLPAAASAQIGGFDVEIPKEEKAAKKKKQDIVDVRLDASWKGPKSVDEALALVKEGGEIVLHPGVYPPEAIKVRKSVTIRGIRDSYGEAPVLVASGSCLSVAKDGVAARITDVTFSASDATCISVSKGQLELADSEIRGKNAGFYRGATPPHLRAFNSSAATSSRSALVAVRGGRVSITNTKLVGGETGVMINPGSTGNAFEHVSLRENTIAQMTGAGVVMVGNVDAMLSANSIVNNGMGGVVYNASGHARLVGNIISNNAYTGLYIEGNDQDAVSVERNRIHDNTSDGIEVRSGVAILVGNEIGDHRGCRIKEEPFARGTSEHLSKPPITLLADAQGVNAYKVKDGCDRGESENKKERWRWFSRGE
ncbi:MAG: right-handed parallel beta-helix repeat-containing protein [Pseudomonadota bacterium]